MNLTAFHLCEQLARHWEERGAYGGTAAGTYDGVDNRRFAETTPTAESVASAAYAGAMPVRADRMSPCVAFIPFDAPGQTGNVPTTPIGVQIVCRAATLRGAMDALTDVRSLLRSGTGGARPFAWTPDWKQGSPGFFSGVVGLPPIAPGSTTNVWRIIHCEIGREPETDTPELGTPSGGEAQASMYAVFHCVPFTTPAMTAALSLYRPSSGVFAARAGLRGTRLLLEEQASDGASYTMNEIDLATVGTIADVVTALAGYGWTGAVLGGLGARNAARLRRVQVANALGSGNTIAAGVFE